MTQVVRRQKPSVHTPYQAMGEDLGVSVTLVYNKLHGVEADTSRALVRYGAGAARRPLPRQARLHPGACAARSRVQASLWIADRNFCTAGFLRGLIETQANGLICAHEQGRFRPLEPMRESGRIATGAVDTRWVELTDANAQGLRPVRLPLDKSTRDGDREAVSVLQRRSGAARSRPWPIHRRRCALWPARSPPATCWRRLRAAHSREAADALSGYHMALELSSAAGSLDTVLDPQDLGRIPCPPGAGVRRLAAGAANESATLPKKSAPKCHNNSAKTHVSVARLLAQRKRVAL